MQYRFARFPEGRAKAFTASYDDGSRFDRKLLDIMNGAGIKCTLNINGGFTDSNDGWHLTAEELAAIADGGGHEIAQHCAHHIAPGLASSCTVMREVLLGRQMLERQFHRIVRGMAYPDSGILRTFSTDYATVRRILQEAGVAYSRSLGGDNDAFLLPEDWYNWVPTAHHENAHLFEWLDAFVSADTENRPLPSQQPLLFYLWGHSFEFDNRNNWDRLEAICEKAGGRADVWYATNLEIRDYMAAYDALQFDVDETRVYNPSRVPVWFVADRKTYAVGAGETLSLS